MIWKLFYCRMRWIGCMAGGAGRLAGDRCSGVWAATIMVTSGIAGRAGMAPETACRRLAWQEQWCCSVH